MTGVLGSGLREQIPVMPDATFTKASGTSVDAALSSAGGAHTHSSWRCVLSRKTEVFTNTWRVSFSYARRQRTQPLWSPKFPEPFRGRAFSPSCSAHFTPSLGAAPNWPTQAAVCRLGCPET